MCHRLDTETSGCLVMARSKEGQQRISAAFAEGRVHKEYAAVARGTLPDEGACDVPLGEWKRGRVLIGKGRAAWTLWTVRWRGARGIGVLAVPVTGRTHQVRAHLSEAGAPILGDPTYGGAPADRLYLHAWRLTLPWPGPGDTLEVTSPLPAGFEA